MAATRREFIKKTPELSELTNGVSLFKMVIPLKQSAELPPLSPAALTVQNNIFLPSYENMNDLAPTEAIANVTLKTKRENLFKETTERPFRGLFLSLKHLPRAHSAIDWAGGLIVIPLVNMVQIALTTILEFGVRTLGAVLMQPGKIINGWIDSVKTMNPIAKFGLKALTNLITSPLWCIAQILSLFGDVLAYSRQLMDSAIRLVNPLWWTAKAINSITGKNIIKNSGPSFKNVTTTFVSSLFKLLPAAAIVTTGILTAGVSVPALQGLAPLQAAGASIAVIYLSGAVAAISKLFSGTVNVVTHILTEPKKTHHRNRSLNPSVVLAHSHNPSAHHRNPSVNAHKRFPSSSTFKINIVTSDGKPAAPDGAVQEQPHSREEVELTPIASNQRTFLDVNEQKLRSSESAVSDESISGQRISEQPSQAPNEPSRSRSPSRSQGGE